MSEHHASEDGYLPAPLTMAAAIAAVTSRTTIMVAAALLPLYDPVRLAEEMIVLDHLSRGRVMYTLGLGYRPVEYELLGFGLPPPWGDRRREARRAPRATSGRRPTDPCPADDPRALLVERPVPHLGRVHRPGCRPGRAGTGWASSPRPTIPSLAAVYEEAARAAGHAPGLCIIPPSDSPSSVFVAADVDEGWRDVGEALLADAISYRSWNEEAGNVDANVTLTAGATVAELRAANGSHRVVSVADAVALDPTLRRPRAAAALRRAGPGGGLALPAPGRARRAAGRREHAAVSGRLILLCGIAGAGKTTLAKQLEAEGAVRMCPDEWLDALGSTSTTRTRGSRSRASNGSWLRRSSSEG